MRILIATSEAVPFAKTGGLADVTGSLLKEYQKTSDCDAHLVLPLYRGIRERFDLVEKGVQIQIPVGSRRYDGRIWSSGTSVYFVECDEFFDRPELYGTTRGDYPDNAARFVFFSRAVIETCMAMGLQPDIIHCNDWQTGLIPLYLKTRYKNDFFSRTATMLTIHNLGYQGLFSSTEFPLIGLGPEWFTPEGVEFYGKVNFLKAGLISADMLTTVSSTYAEEILTPEFGYGLDGVLRRRSSVLHGVINGIDMEVWDPREDTALPARYDSETLEGKATCKKGLLEECSLKTAGKDAPVLAVVGRLSEQKGLDVFLESADDFLASGAQIVILGKGDEHLHRRVLGFAEKNRGSVSVTIGYDESFARRIYAGSDLFLMPSRYEPCGIGQLIAMRYGTIPVARKTGGLADTVTDYEPLRGYGTGFLFEEYRPRALSECVKRALCVYVDKRRWKRMVLCAMNMDFSWKKSAAKYRELYSKAKTSKGH